ncbi:MAG: hypothetical protein CMN31_28900, partial [Sandaracinus sp.]|nr:hypothetical protein [Sandaracinus sp.]
RRTPSDALRTDLRLDSDDPGSFVFPRGASGDAERRLELLGPRGWTNDFSRLRAQSGCPQDSLSQDSLSEGPVRGPQGSAGPLGRV